MKIYYGVEDCYMDITKKVVFCKRDKDNNNYFISSDDVHRASIFGDPVYGVLKHIITISYDKTRNTYKIKRYEDNVDILISRKEYEEF